jgi:hypothetical protein
MTVTATDVAPVQTLTTPWTKALDFSGSAQRAQQVVNTNTYSPLRMGGLSATVSGGSAGMTSSNTSARPWATAIVFNVDGHNSNQHIWNQGEGAGSNDDNIYIRLSASRQVFVGWGRDGSKNEIYLATLSSGTWYGLYVASTGERLGSANATAANLADCFDIRFVNLSTGDAGTNRSTTTYWNASLSTTGGSMNRSVGGEFTVGGRGSNRSFHGKVASMVVTTLKRNEAMPDDTEISMMVRDPQRWVNDYKLGESYRPAGQSYNNSNFQRNTYSAITGTQVWLMGNTQYDAFAKMRNQVFASDQNYTPLNMISMVSNDIQSITIPGLD